LRLAPTIAVVTNIDPEHLDHYGSLPALEDAFVAFANKIPFFGTAVMCLDHPRVRALLPRIEKRIVTYGLEAGAEYQAEAVRAEGMSMRFIASKGGARLGEVTLRIPGAHNVENALAALAVADALGIPFDVYRDAVAAFGGVARRFSQRGEAAGILVVDDYGHHPAEIRATLAGATGGFDRRLVVAFQPHRYTRTRDLLAEFAAAFDEAALVFVTDIYGAGEEPIPGVDAARLCEALRAHGHPGVHHVPARADLAGAAARLLRPGDLFLTLGAGDIWKSGEELLALLRQEASV
jgi:UDP-N-acetylmuramate--alanine ligase